MEIEADFVIGDRMTIKISRFTVVGFSVKFFDLKDDYSLALQLSGLGGKRKIGCGVFNR